MKWYISFLIVFLAVFLSILYTVPYGPPLKYLATLIDSYRQPPINGTLFIDGLQSPVEIIRDANGVPHIFAENVHDMIFAQAFIHAQERFWQMEIFRRFAKGTLSEIFKESTLDLDKVTRSLGFRRHGVGDTNYLKNSTAYPSMVAYAEGVNAYLNSEWFILPLEFIVIGHSNPEPWTIEDTITHHRFFNWQMCRGWVREIVRLNLVQAVGEDLARELEAIHSDSPLSFILPNGTQLNKYDIPPLSDPSPEPDNQWIGVAPENGGSNWFAISGNHTTSGKSYFASDPHLALINPGMWLPMEMKCPGYHWVGLSVPALPWVMVGSNDDFAFGITLSHADIEDVYIEKTRGNEYLFQGEWKPMMSFNETIHIKGKPPVQLTTYHTQHGVILDEDIFGKEFSKVPLSSTEKGEEDVIFRYALKSTALMPNATPAIGLVKMMSSHSVQEAFESVKLIPIPPSNFLFADSNNIAYYLAANIPIRSKGDGTTPVPGWTGEYEWTGYVPVEEKPMSINPESGYLFSANNKPVPDSYRYFLGKSWAQSFRAQRLQQLLQEHTSHDQKISFEQFSRIQQDTLSLAGLLYRDYVLSIFPDPENVDPVVAELLDILRNWNGSMDPNSVGGAVYQVSKMKVYRKILESRLAPELADYAIGKGFNPLIKPANEINGFETSILLGLLQNTSSLWMTKVGGARRVMEEALGETAECLDKQQHPHEYQSWGDIHLATFRHLFTAVAPLAAIFDVGPLLAPGDGDSISMSAMLLHSHTHQVLGWGVSARVLIDFNRLHTDTQWVSFPGVSGRLGSPFYANWVSAYSNGQTYPTFATRPSLLQNSVGQVLLLPH